MHNYAEYNSLLSFLLLPLPLSLTSLSLSLSYFVCLSVYLSVSDSLSFYASEYMLYQGTFKRTKLRKFKTLCFQDWTNWKSCKYQSFVCLQYVQLKRGRPSDAL